MRTTPMNTNATHKVGKTAAVVAIGNELLSGRVRDANVQYLAKQLKTRGVAIYEARLIRDDIDTIVRTLNEMRTTYSYVFTTGGIGPTHDDITADAVAKAFDTPLIINEEASNLLEEFYSSSKFSPARQRMARIPIGGTLLYNPVSVAPGFQIGNVFVLPGVPHIMQAIVDGFVQNIEGGEPLQAMTLTVFVGESHIAPHLAACQEAFPDIEMGSYPFLHACGFGVSMVLRGCKTTFLKAATEDLQKRLSILGQDVRIEDGEVEAPEKVNPEKVYPETLV